MKTVLLVLLMGLFIGKSKQSNETLSERLIKLPEPIYQSETSVEEAIKSRRSVRAYKEGPLSLQQLSQMLWAAQGITSGGGYRTAPSAGALYPLEVYVVVGDVSDLSAGVYKYHPQRHGITQEVKGDKRRALAQASVMQSWMAKAPAMLVITGIYQRTTVKYGARGKRYVHMEVGHAAQNIYLQAVSLNLGTVMVGAFVDTVVKTILTLKKAEEPLAILPVGLKK
jgi:SagB-type dehydrogenase family enzyme